MNGSVGEGEALKEAINRAEGQGRLAVLVNEHLDQSGVDYRPLTQARVSKWLCVYGRVETAECVLAIEAVTGVDRCRLRSDLYPVDDYRNHDSALSGGFVDILPSVEKSA